MSDLLTRDQFREGVLKRDKNLCVFCKQPATAAHHILERRLFNDGGYYLDNGASVCDPCHIKCEETTLSCEQVREAAGITKAIFPAHLYEGEYTKWGDPILSNGNRLKGELFHDASVQKILAQGGVLGLYSDRVKFPRTFHLPWSPGLSKDDRVMGSLEGFEGQEVVVTAKYDGENTTFYSDFVHARSIEYHPHASRDLIKALHSRVCGDIPVGFRLCGENLFAKHSIEYKKLPSYFLLFHVWNEKNECLSWDETLEWAALLGLETVPTLYHGVWDQKKIEKLYRPQFNDEDCEGYVVRVAGSFHYGDYRNKVGKYVRAGHVGTHGHWMTQKVVKNDLAKN